MREQEDKNTCDSGKTKLYDVIVLSSDGLLTLLLRIVSQWSPCLLTLLYDVILPSPDGFAYLAFEHSFPMVPLSPHTACTL